MYAREVEEVLVRAPGVRDAAVIGVPDRLWGEAVTAVLTAENGAGDSDAVLAHCRTVLPGYRVPERVSWCDELPRTSYGKILESARRPERGAIVGCARDNIALIEQYLDLLFDAAQSTPPGRARTALASSASS